MIIDTSAIVSVVHGETDSIRLLLAIRNAPERRLSAATYLEAGIVIDASKDRESSISLDNFVQSLGVTIEPVTENQAKLARQAYSAFGKGSGHRARLNFGDCFSYALAIDMNEPLLFKGDDFNHTDVRVAVPPMH